MIRKKSTKKDKRNGVVRESYNVPDQVDLDNLKVEYEKFACKLENNKSKPLTENQLKQIIRSAVRKKWMFHPVKLAFIISKAVPDYDPETRRRFKYQCNICKQWFTKTDVDVDHITGEHQFVDLSQSHQWACSILDVGFDDLQLLCNITCHPIKTLAESQHITFEQAVILKQVIEWENEYKGDPIQFLVDLGADKRDVSNSKKRRVWYLNHLSTK
jgi:hypothetical protein